MDSENELLTLIRLEVSSDELTVAILIIVTDHILLLWLNKLKNLFWANKMIHRQTPSDGAYVKKPPKIVLYQFIIMINEIYPRNFNDSDTAQ